MRTVGILEFDSPERARESLERLGPPAQTVVREVTRAMDFDRAEYRDRVDSAVVETAREALFGSLLAVTVGTRAEYEEWREAYEGIVHEAGSEHVEHVVWHAGPTGEAVAATFQDEEAAAIATLRRQAFGRLYRPLFETAGEDHPEPDAREDG